MKWCRFVDDNKTLCNMMPIIDTANLICLTPNGTKVKHSLFDYKVLSNGKVNKNLWYVGHDDKYEYWQSERKDSNGDYQVYESKVLIKGVETNE